MNATAVHCPCLRTRQGVKTFAAFVFEHPNSYVMSAVTLPRFASASQPSNVPHSSGPNFWGNDVIAGELDFEMLAEYLLDDETSAEGDGLLGLDFNIEASSQSGYISPSEDGTPELGVTEANNTLMHVQNIITAHAAAQGNAQILAPAPPRQAHSHSGSPMGPAPPAPAAFFNFVAAPAPIAAAPTVVLHQHGAAAAKRRRMDAPMMAVGDAMKNQFMSPPQIPHGRGRTKSQAQIDRRRERNRILARRTRLRKKFFFESLQKDVIEMQRENAALKEIVRTKLDEDTSKNLLAECNAMEQLPSGVLEACGEDTDMDGQDYNLVKSIQQSQQCFVISDPSLHDNPIVYASEGFLKLTGYSSEEVLGRNCRFLQGTETSAEKVEQVRKAVANCEDVSVTMINYTADGTAFWNKMFIAALRDAQNNIVNFIGVIVKVAAPEPGDPEEGKVLPGQQMEEADGGNVEMADDAIEHMILPGVPGPFFS